MTQKVTMQNSLNTLTANYECFRSNRENLPLPIQMQVSGKPKNIFSIFIAFLEYSLNLNISLTTNPHSLSISEVIDCETRAYLNT